MEEYAYSGWGSVSVPDYWCEVGMDQWKQLTLYYLRMSPMMVVPTMCVVAMVTVTMVMITSLMVVAMVHVVSVVMLVSMVTVTMVMMTTTPMMEDKDTNEIHQEPQNRDHH